MDLAAIYPDGILMAVLRPQLPDAGVGTEQPADVMARLPYLVARETPGAGDTDDRFAQAVGVQLDAYATTRREARQLAGMALLLLRQAQRDQTVTPDGYLAQLTVTAFPFELREADQPSGFARYVATVSTIVRPPA